MTVAVPFNHQNLPQQVADHIVLLVASGEFNAGDRVYEKDICDRLAVSRIPVREAFRLLEAQGVMRGEPNRGSFVTGLGSQQIAEMMEVRIVAERIAGRHVIARIKSDPAVIDTIRSAMDGLHRAIRVGDRLAFCQADLAFHATLIGLADSPILEPIWASLSRGTLVYLMQEARLEGAYKSSIADHERLIALLEQGDVAAYSAEIERHVTTPPGAKGKRPVRK